VNGGCSIKPRCQWQCCGHHIDGLVWQLCFLRLA
jgi:hypothetical protein